MAVRGDVGRVVDYPELLWLFALAAFQQAVEFNGDVSKWDVSSVTTLRSSKCRSGWERMSMWLGREMPGGLLLLEVA
jgi:hypothetical protein